MRLVENNEAPMENQDRDFFISIESEKIIGLCIAIQNLCETIQEKRGDDIDVLQMSEAIYSVSIAIREAADCIHADTNY